ncbi:MAG: entericidin A/B family lipoprotein [Luteolibacter sp.]
MKTSVSSILKVAIATALLGALASCNTAAGFGHDVQKTGQAIERKANS